MPSSEDNVPVDVLVQQINRVVQAGGIELLRTERSHPDEIVNPDFVPGIAKKIEALTFQHEQPVLHDVRFDGREADAGLEKHQVHLKIEPQVAHGQQMFEAATLQPGMVRHRHGLLLTDDRGWRGNALGLLIAFLDGDDAGGCRGMTRHREGYAGGNIDKGADSKLHWRVGADGPAPASCHDVEEVLEIRADRLGRAARGLDLQDVLGKTGTEGRRRQKAHRRGRPRRKPTLQHALRRYEREVATDNAAIVSDRSGRNDAGLARQIGGMHLRSSVNWWESGSIERL